MGAAQDKVINTRESMVSSQVTGINTYLSNELSTPENADITDYELSELVNEITGIVSVRVQIIDQSFEIITDTYQINQGKICITEAVNLCFNETGANKPVLDRENECIVMTLPIYAPVQSLDESQDQEAAESESEQEILYVMYATSSVADIYQAMDDLRLFAASITVIAAIIIVFAAIIGSYIVTKPFGVITKTINRVDEGHMEEKIDLKGVSEVEDISAAFNKMLARINQLENSRQDFVSNVSHELKTPLTSMKILADSLIVMDDVPVEMYREFMEDMSGEIDRGNAIIEDLLTLVRMEKSELSLNFTSVNINTLLETTLKTIRPLAQKKNVEIVLESLRDVNADVDEVKFSMAVSNLIENAVKYNNPEGWVHVFLNADQTYFYIKIQDNGIGIPEESLDHIFDRFYRVDKSRSRESGGTGLGLSITKQIVLAHSGQIKVYSEEGLGTTFSIQVPLT